MLWMCPPSFSTRMPAVCPAWRVSSTTLPTAAMEASASPRKPSVSTRDNSSAVRNLLVAWRSKASTKSSGEMPEPLSTTWKEARPPSLMSTVMLVAPASMLFSTNSLMAAAGRSTTSPAAIWPMTSFDSL